VIHLHVRSWFSFLAGASSPEALAARAAALGQPACALTDLHGVYGAVRFAAACRREGISPIFGATLIVEGYPLVLLAANPEGYANLNRLASQAHLMRPQSSSRPPFGGAAQEGAPTGSARRGYHAVPKGGGTRPRPVDSGLPVRGQTPRAGAPTPGLRMSRAPGVCPPVEEGPRLSLEEVVETEGLIALTGGPEGRLDALVRSGRLQEARRWLERLARLFPERLYVEMVHRRRPGDSAALDRLAELAGRLRLPLAASNAVRYAHPDDYALYDALTCVRLGLTVGDPHPERPVNDAAWLAPEEELRRLIPYPEAFASLGRIAAACRLELLPDRVSPPTARLPEGVEADAWLRHLCEEGLARRYPCGSPEARRQMEHELRVVADLELSEFFLVVHEVVRFARSRGIRCAGRGSAANSILAYLLEITEVDPLEHDLLFERFLHRGRKGMPDIDVDFDSERRDEVIEWMEQRFGTEHAAMTANVNTYQVKSAVRDMLKVLGWDMVSVNKVAKILSSRDSMRDLSPRRQELAEILGDGPMLDVLLALVARLEDCPRHLSLHLGGMVLSRRPLAYYSPVQISARGVRQLQFNKDDVEALGLIKFDVLGLRSLAVISEAVSLHHADTGEVLDPDSLTFDDEATFERIRRGETMSVFQIESPGQWNLLSRTQPRNFRDLVVQVALFRPGPIQGGMIHPYLRRRAGSEEVTFLHPCLEPILRDTLGIILFQEQVLEICHVFAGMSLEEADRFRALMSRWRDPGKMEDMRVRFVEGAQRTQGVSRPVAEEIFRQVAAFVGYGFCRSHAAAFARTVYQTAWLKTHYPAAYMAAVLQHAPGFYPMSTVLEEARHLGVRILPVDAWRSGVRYQLEGGAIRIPLTQVQGMSDEMAARLVLGRGGCADLESLLEQVDLPADCWEALARAGAFDSLMSRREALWRVGLHLRQPRSRAPQPTLFPSPFDPALVPEFDPLDEGQMVAWDFATQGLTPRTHPVGLHRAALQRLGVRPIATLFADPAGVQRRVAGLVISLQRPPTAKGMCFLVLEDETGRLPTAITPPVFARLRATLRHGALVVEGRLEEGGPGYRSLLVARAWTLASLLSGAPPPTLPEADATLPLPRMQGDFPRHGALPRRRPRRRAAGP
jgi:error-prone DNA polymerase